MKSILITGINGFVGGNLETSLKQKHTIYGLDIISSQKEGVLKTFSWNELDKIPSVNLIIHLAGKAHDTKNTTDEKDYFDINVGLTQTIFEYFLKSNANKFIFFSSVKAVADSVIGDYLTEEVEPYPGTAYGRSKLEAEKYLTARLNEYTTARKECHPERSEGSFEEGHCLQSGDSSSSLLRMTGQKKVYILRPCMIHGPGNRGNLNLLYKLVQKGLPWPLGAFENKRSFCSIANVQFVIQQLIEKDIEPGIYNMADDEPLSTNRLVQLISASQNKKAHIVNISPKVIKVFARMGDILHLPLNNERLKKLTESYVVSNGKIKKTLGIKRMPIGAEEGLRETLSSF